MAAISSIPVENTVSMKERLDFIKLGRRGVRFDCILQERAEQRQTIVVEKTQELITNLLQRINETEQVIANLTQEVESMDFLKAGQFQKENLLQTIHKLKEVQMGLKEKLAGGELELSKMKEQKQDLRATLDIFSQTLSSLPNEIPSEQALLKIGEKMCYYISDTSTGYHG